MKANREGALRIDQRIGEQPDIWAMRAFVKALDHPDIYFGECVAKLKQGES